MLLLNNNRARQPNSILRAQHRQQAWPHSALAQHATSYITQVHLQERAVPRGRHACPCVLQHSWHCPPLAGVHGVLPKGRRLHDASVPLEAKPLAGDNLRSTENKPLTQSHSPAPPLHRKLQEVHGAVLADGGHAVGRRAARECAAGQPCIRHEEALHRACISSTLITQPVALSHNTAQPFHHELPLL